MMNLWYVTDLVCAKDTYEYNNINNNNTVYIIEKTTIKLLMRVDNVNLDQLMIQQQMNTLWIEVKWNNVLNKF